MDGFTALTGGDLPPAKGPYSPAVAWNGLVFVSGLLAVKEDGSGMKGDVREEAMVVLRNLERILRSAGSGLGMVLAVTVFLADVEELPAFNEVYEEFFQPPYPARSAVGVSLPGDHRVELAAVAYRA